MLYEKKSRATKRFVKIQWIGSLSRQFIYIRAFSHLKNGNQFNFKLKNVLLIFQVNRKVLEEHPESIE